MCCRGPVVYFAAAPNALQEFLFESHQRSRYRTLSQRTIDPASGSLDSFLRSHVVHEGHSCRTAVWFLAPSGRNSTARRKIPFGSFDILSDEAVRQGLKEHSQWPTYPQFYHQGELVGGLDIVKEIREDDTLRNQLGIAEDVRSEPVLTLDERLGKLVKQHPVMLFMKGLPSAPRCGFSRQMVVLLDEEQISYDTFDILQDEEVRQGLKKFSDWPTYPQLYVNGDLIGGLDIVKEMKEDSSLKEALGA